MPQMLKERVADVERTVAELLAQSREPGRDEWWKTIGMFIGDAVMREIDDQALKIREQNRRESRA